MNRHLRSFLWLLPVLLVALGAAAQALPDTTSVTTSTGGSTPLIPPGTQGITWPVACVAIAWYARGAITQVATVFGAGCAKIGDGLIAVAKAIQGWQPTIRVEEIHRDPTGPVRLTDTPADQ